MRAATKDESVKLTKILLRSRLQKRGLSITDKELTERAERLVSEFKEEIKVVEDGDKANE